MIIAMLHQLKTYFFNTLSGLLYRGILILVQYIQSKFDDDYLEGDSVLGTSVAIFNYSVFLYSFFHYSFFHYSVFHYSFFHYSVFHYSVFHYSVFLQNHSSPREIKCSFVIIFKMDCGL